jgi:hypothetical protein
MSRVCRRDWRPGAGQQIELGSAPGDCAFRRIGNAGTAQETAQGQAERRVATAEAEKAEADR